MLAHPPPVTDHASIFHHARQAAPDEDRHGPGSTTAQTPRRNLAVDAAAGGEATSGKPLIRPEEDIFPDASPLAQSLPVLGLCFGQSEHLCRLEKSMVLLPDHGCYTPLTGTRRRDPGLD